MKAEQELGRAMRAHITAALDAYGVDGLGAGWHNIARERLRAALACCDAIEAMLLVAGTEGKVGQ